MSRVDAMTATLDPGERRRTGNPNFSQRWTVRTPLPRYDAISFQELSRSDLVPAAAIAIPSDPSMHSYYTPSLVPEITFYSCPLWVRRPPRAKAPFYGARNLAQISPAFPGRPPHTTWLPALSCDCRRERLYFSRLCKTPRR